VGSVDQGRDAQVINPLAWYFPQIQAGSLSANNTTFNVLAAGNYNKGGASSGYYHLYEIPITLTFH